MNRNQLNHLPNEMVSAKPKIKEKVYEKKENFLAMSYHQKQSQTKPLIMLSTFCGAFDVPHRKRDNKTIPAMVDMYNQNMGGVGASDQVMYSYASWSKKVVFNLLSRLVLNSYILYKLTVPAPKKRIEYIKDIIDSLA